MKNIYKLKLHETIIIVRDIDEDRYYTAMVTRVPGGWLYNDKVFIPFSNEFMTDEVES